MVVVLDTGGHMTSYRYPSVKNDRRQVPVVTAPYAAQQRSAIVTDWRLRTITHARRIMAKINAINGVITLMLAGPVPLWRVLFLHTDNMMASTESVTVRVGQYLLWRVISATVLRRAQIYNCDDIASHCVFTRNFVVYQPIFKISCRSILQEICKKTVYNYNWIEPVSCKCSKWRPLAFPHARSHPHSPGEDTCLWLWRTEKTQFPGSCFPR